MKIKPDETKVKVAWFGKHFGEEPPLVGNQNQGAGTIFFTGCNLRCVFCQNYQISQQDLGQEYSISELVEMMLDLQKQGAINIDLVSPTIWWYAIKEAILIAKRHGLNIPIVWNSNAYEALDILRRMKGLVDIYLPDFKYGDNEVGFKYSRIRNYSQAATKAIQEMLNQVGYLKLDQNSVAKKGLLVRHLILPNNLENSYQVLKVLAQIDNKIDLSLMSQYQPLYQAKNYSEINRAINQDELQQVYNQLRQLGFEQGWIQEEDGRQCFVPDFRRVNPFV